MISSIVLFFNRDWAGGMGPRVDAARLGAVVVDVGAAVVPVVAVVAAGAAAGAVVVAVAGAVVVPAAVVACEAEAGVDVSAAFCPNNEVPPRGF
jgi:hypothetical protein